MTRLIYMHFFLTVPAEKMVIYKERASGWYRLSAYYLAKMISELPLILLQPLLFLSVVYWVVGLNGAAAFFATIGTIFVHSIAGQVRTFVVLISRCIQNAQRRDMVGI